MAVITLACPHCSFSKEMDRSVLPPLGTTITCPRCRGTFPLSEKALSPPGVSPGATPGDESAPSPGCAFDDPVSPLQRPPSQRPERRVLTFTFTGSGKEYFGIWIVNTLLRIVTLGIYSPWAKVRKRRYFLANTLVDDAPFDYLANPLAILKGWFIAGSFFGLYSLASKTNPLLASSLGLVIFIVLPWVIVRSRQFNLRNTTHRNIPFDFAPDYGEAYEVFLAWQLAIPFTMGLLAPYVIFRQKRFLVEKSSYGGTRFRFHGSARDYYRLFLPIIAGLLVCVALVTTAVIFAKNGLKSPVLPVAAAVCTAITYLLGAVYVTTALTNLTWNSTSFADHRFESTLSPWKMAWIYLSNIVAIIGTAGLLTPWATVRLLRYRLERLTISGTGGLEVAAAVQDGTATAAAEEFGDMLGFDLGL